MIRIHVRLSIGDRAKKIEIGWANEYEKIWSHLSGDYLFNLPTGVFFLILIRIIVIIWFIFRLDLWIYIYIGIS